jgi:hypothetical protein
MPVDPGVFANLPSPDWKRNDSVHALTAEATEALHGLAPTTAKWAWARQGPDASFQPTPNQHIVGLGVAAVVEGVERHDAAIRRWYEWHSQAFMGKTYKRAEFLGGDYQNLYILGSVLILVACRRHGAPAGLRDLPVTDLERHMAVNILLRHPGGLPRSSHIGARCGFAMETCQSALASVLSGRPDSEWGRLNGQQLVRQLRRPARLTGILALEALLDAGEIDRPRFDSFTELLDHIRVIGLRPPWPLRLRADGAPWPTAWAAELLEPFPAKAERTGGLLTATSAPADTVSGSNWDLTLGPDGLEVHRAPAGHRPHGGDPISSEPDDPDLEKLRQQLIGVRDTHSVPKERRWAHRTLVKLLALGAWSAGPT